jgi:hypothetical protein
VSGDVRPATPDRWSDVVSVFGRRGDDPSWCWCRRFLGPAPNDAAKAGALPDNRSALRDEIAEARIPPGLIAYVDDQPVGWTRVGPHGATTVEGHPVDVAALTAARVAGSAVFTGTLAMFSAAAFTEVARTYPTRPVMRLSL